MPRVHQQSKSKARCLAGSCTAQIRFGIGTAAYANAACKTTTRTIVAAQGVQPVIPRPGRPRRSGRPVRGIGSEPGARARGCVLCSRVTRCRIEG